MTSFLLILAILFAMPFAFMVALAAGMGWREAAHQIDKRRQREKVAAREAQNRACDQAFARGFRCGIAWEKRQTANDEHEHRRSAA